MIKKQFIAGAACPQCEAIDKIQLVSETDEQGCTSAYHTCIACGYHRSDTEFEEWEDKSVPMDPEVQSVQIMQPKKGS